MMEMLNRLFASFDKLPANHNNMLKIKCIGDCSMNAGGIFDEVNQPSIHEKQSTMFGLDMITSIELFGPAISIAAAMEHNGFPTNVHIPQHMYELFYWDPFMFEERGDMEIKGKIIKRTSSAATKYIRRKLSSISPQFPLLLVSLSGH
jgi:hypothetical protein